MKQNRFKSWALWMSIAALVVFLLQQFAGIDISSPVNEIMTLVLPILVAFGIINDPTNREGF